MGHPRAAFHLPPSFAAAGYRVAAAAAAHLSASADLSEASSVRAVFGRVRAELGGFPHVVVWNAATRTACADGEGGNIFSVPAGGLERDLGVAVCGAWAAADEAVKGWTAEGREVRGVFVYTGNVMAKAIFPHLDFTTLGTAKRAACYMIEAADAMYKAKGWRFYYADERTPEGKPMGRSPNAASHARMYLQLAEGGGAQLPTYVTFAEGEYKSFESPGAK